jgi:hypothetical protein
MIISEACKHKRASFPNAHLRKLSVPLLVNDKVNWNKTQQLEI